MGEVLCTAQGYGSPCYGIYANAVERWDSKAYVRVHFVPYDSIATNQLLDTPSVVGYTVSG